MKSHLNKLPAPNTLETTCDVIEISDQLMPSFPPVSRSPTTSPKPMNISKMTNELSTIVYLNNDRVSTKFSMWKIGNVTLYTVKRKAYADIEKILKIDYDYFEFIKVEAKMAYKGLLKGCWPTQVVRTYSDWEGVESRIGLWRRSFNKAIHVNNKVIYKRRVQDIPQIPIVVAGLAIAIPVGIFIKFLLFNM
jgi:hypothetical protein